MLVAEGAVEAALAQAGRYDNVVQRGCRVSRRPEPFSGGEENLRFVKFSGSGHAASISVLDGTVQNL